ncbi:hypothetical protein FTUN_2518 [Frigoriglobus tundricola]|uniref:Uncharacterized protein n=1 Tax=Frigoriglobus tundricola TaxID=2774151 RepID=A0A6M5YPU4_9BACT|nr:hypothetical protein FTUN_2518 [Frigoriglobus tundricola]
MLSRKAGTRSGSLPARMTRPSLARVLGAGRWSYPLSLPL